MAFILNQARKAVQSKINSFIDAQVTSQLKPFLEIGTGPDGSPCSDFVVNEDGDMSIENMMLKPHIINERLVQMGSPLRVAMVRCKRVFLDLPWGDLASGKWNLEIDDLMIVLYPLEQGSWSVEDLKKAKEAAIAKALTALTAKMKALEAKRGGGGIADTIKKRLLGGVHLTVNVSSVHFRLERDEGVGPGAPPFAVGFLLPHMGVKTSIDENLNNDMAVTIGQVRELAISISRQSPSFSIACSRLLSPAPASSLALRSPFARPSLAVARLCWPFARPSPALAHTVARRRSCLSRAARRASM